MQAVFIKAETFACVQFVILTLIVNDCFAFQCGQDGVAGGAVWGQAGARIECHQHKLHVVCVDKVNIGNAALFVRNQVFQGCGLASFDDVVQDSILLFQNNFSIDHTDIRAGSTQCFGRNSQKIIPRKGNCPAIFA